MSVLYTLQDCGCLALALVDEPRTIKECAADIYRQVKLGRTIYRAENPPDLRCPEHRREEAEKSSLVEMGL